MKKILSTMFLLSMVCLTLVYCINEKEIRIKIPFELADIESVEMYSYKLAKKKLVTRNDDIESIYKIFSSILVINKKIGFSEDGKKIIFKFNLLDGKSYEIIYMGKAVKSGMIVIPSEGLEYFSKSDILGFWDNYNYDEIDIDIDRNELHLYAQE